MVRTVPSTHEPVLPAQSADEARPTSAPADWSSMVLGTAHAAATLLGTQAIGSILIASLSGAPFEFRRFLGVVPYAGLTQQQDLATTLTWATALAVFVTGTAALFMLWRRRESPLYVLGWSAGLPMAGMLLFFQYLRHASGPPVLDLWVAAQAAAFLVAAGLISLAFFPPLAASGKQVVTTGTPRGPIEKDHRS